MRLTIVCIAAAYSLGAVAASAETAPAAAPTEAPKPKKICRPIVSATGSHLGSRRACRTAEEWREIDRTDVDASMVSSGRSTSSATSNSGN